LCTGDSPPLVSPAAFIASRDLSGNGVTCERIDVGQLKLTVRVGRWIIRILELLEPL